MNKDLKLLGGWMLRYAAALLLMALPVVLFQLDVHWLGNRVNEWSLVELVAEGFLAICVIGYLRLARASVPDRGFAVLAAGLFGAMLVRELDSMWDLVFDGLWQLLALGVVASALAVAGRDPAATLASLRRFLVSRENRTMLAGLVILLGFSRLFGMGSLWSALIDAENGRVVKNAIEECTELLGYSFILLASTGYVRRRMRALERRLARARGNRAQSAPAGAEVAADGGYA